MSLSHSTETEKVKSDVQKLSLSHSTETETKAKSDVQKWFVHYKVLMNLSFSLYINRDTQIFLLSLGDQMLSI